MWILVVDHRDDDRAFHGPFSDDRDALQWAAENLPIDTPQPGDLKNLTSYPLNDGSTWSIHPVGDRQRTGLIFHPDQAVKLLSLVGNVNEHWARQLVEIIKGLDSQGII